MYRTILTKIGRSKIGNFVLTQQPVLLKHFAVGDSHGTPYTPTEDQTALKNEKYRVEISKAEVLPQGDINKVSVEAILASSVGGFLINEVGLFDEAGDLIAIARQPERFKPLTDDGTTSEMKFIIEFYISNASSVQIKVNPSMIVITQEDLNQHNSDQQAHEDIRNSIKGHIQDKNNPHAVTAVQIGAAAEGHKHQYNEIENLPSSFPPASHTHTKNDIGDFEHNHDERYYTEEEVNHLLLGKAPSGHVDDRNNPHGVTEDQVGLGSVQNYPVATEEEALAGLAHDRYLTPYLMARAARGNMRTRFVSGRGVSNAVIAHITSAKGGVAQIHYQIHNSLTKLKITCDGIVILDGAPMVTFYENNARTQNDIWIYYTSSLVIEHSGSPGALNVEIFVHEYV